MIERRFIAQKIKEFQIQEYITSNLKNVGHSHTKMLKTPLGEKIIVYASRPGLIVGKRGQNIKKLTTDLKEKFGLENPQIEISEVENIYLDAQIVAENIANSLERFGSSKFKGIGHKMMTSVMGAGAYGVEILVSGKIPSARARTWRFYQGYLKKCGDISLTGVDIAYASAELKTGTVGIKVSIMPPTTKLPDDITIYSQEPVIEEVKEEKSDDKKTKKKISKKEKQGSDKAHEREKVKEEPDTVEETGETVEDMNKEAEDEEKGN